MTGGSTARQSSTCTWPAASFAPSRIACLLARAVNTGLSALVDGNGEIRESLAKESKGVLSVTVPLDRRTSYYSRWGDWLGLTCLAISIGLVPLAVLRKSGTPTGRPPEEDQATTTPVSAVQKNP